MRQLFVPKSWIDPQNNQVLLVDDPFHHLIHVLRKKKGQWVEAFDGEGGAYRAQIVEVLQDKVILEIGERKVVSPGEAFSLTLGVAILKGMKMNWVIQKVTELGVGTLVPLITRRTVARPTDHGPAKAAKWQKVAVEAAKQCGRAFVPNIHHPIRMDDFLEQVSDYDARLLAWEDQSKTGDKNLKAWTREWAAAAGGSAKPFSVLLIVGPEGGFDPKEIEQAKSHGCAFFGLGRNILRSETAALIACAIVSYEMEHALSSPTTGERVG